MALEVTSTAFQEGQAIPKQYTGDGQNSSPPLKWQDPPAGTRSLALICEDPDAPRGTFTHWLVFNIPVQTRELSEGLPGQACLPDGTTQGSNDFGKVGYGGPAPPRGKPHRYAFKLFALNEVLGLHAGATPDEFRKAVEGHVLAQGQLTGTYARGG